MYNVYKSVHTFSSYISGTFTQNYKITIGVDFALKSLQWDENTLITLQLW